MSLQGLAVSHNLVEPWIKVNCNIAHEQWVYKEGHCVNYTGIALETIKGHSL